MSTALTARIVEEYASASRALTRAGVASARRRAAIASLSASGLPTSRDENWKYANLRPLERQRFVPAREAPPAALELPPTVGGFARYVFVDGVFASRHSAALDSTAAAVTLQAEAGADGSTAAADGDARFALLNQAFATETLGIRVPAATPAPVRLELIFAASADAARGASYPRIELRLDPAARLVLIERHLSAGSQASFVASAVLAELAPRASLEHYRLQELNARSILFDTLSASLAEHAAYQLHTVSTGAHSARSTVAVRIQGERADLALAVAALGDRQQVQDTFARVEHAAPRAHTVQTFRGIAAGRARVAFNGKIVVAENAAGTDSQQSLRGLLAGPEAEVDVRPQLEIYTDEVRCSHGATAGKLDENMLFYLLSRGLSPETARRLLKWAFLEDVIAQISVPELRRQIEAGLTIKMRDDALRELL